MAAGGGVAVLGAQHADQLAHHVGALEAGHRGRGSVRGRVLDDREVAVGERGDLGQVGDADDLAAAREVAQLLADGAGGLAADAVLIDDASGGQTAGRHLLARGHRRIAAIGAADRLVRQRERLAGFARAMRQAGNDEWAPYLRANVLDAADAEHCVVELLTAQPPPTALFTANNRITTGALRALRDRRHPPALVGFDDFDLAELLRISVVAYDAVELGRQAARLALERIAGGTGPHRTILMPTHLVSRGSGEIDHR